MWHDGRPFGADDVKFTLDLARNRASGSIFAARLADVTEVTTPDAATVVVKLARPNPSFLDLLTKVMMLPKHHLEAVPVDQIARHAWWSTTPIGTGPFAFVRYETDQFVELRANERYRLGRPKLDGVINRYFRNSAAAVAALRAGEIQFTYVESDDAPGFANRPEFRVIAGDSYVLNYIGFNHATPLWQDVRVRRAVMHALDRNAIVQSLLGGAARVANGAYVAPQLQDPAMDELRYDPALARRLLTEAGWERINGARPINLVTYYNSPQAANIMAAMQAMLGQVGIAVAPRAVDVPTYNAMVYAQSPEHSAYPLVYAGLQNGPDPSGVNVGLNRSQFPPSGANIMRADFPPLSAALDAALAEGDPARATERYRAVNLAFNQNLPWAPMWVATRYGVASTRIRDFVWIPAPAGGGYAASAEKWAL
jgi:peptide/nickel transport system substrate-binding protein